MSSISIIIPTLNEQEYIAALLQSIADQDFKGTYEVIVVDGKSEDDTCRVARGFMNIIPNLTVYSSRRGVAAQRNYGASSARYANIIFLDADMLLTPDFLQQISMKYECLKDFVAIPRLMAYDGKLLDTFFTYFGNLYISLNKKSRPILCGMCIITTKNVHDKLKGFDETLSYAEDIDYGQRAHELHIPYYIFSDILANSSTRRLQAISRTKLALLWLSWHIGAYRNGARNLQGRDEYTYGNFKKQ